MPDEPSRKRRWRFYRTESGQEPVREFLPRLSLGDKAEVAAAMKDVEIVGLTAVRHVRADIYEVRADGATQSFRLLFATEGRHSQILLALEAFSKKTRKTPPQEITLAEARLADWRRRKSHP